MIGFGDLLIKGVREALYPPICLKCRQTYYIPIEQSASAKALHNHADARIHSKEHSRRLMTSYLCNQCRSGLSVVTSPLCLQCGMMFKSREGDDHLCAKCLKAEFVFRKARAFGVYNETLKNLIFCFKYQSKIQLEKPFAYFLLATFVRYWEPRDIDIIAPVPLHWKRMYQRGFNQAYLMIRKWPQIAPSFEIELGAIQIEREILLRQQRTASQVGMSVRERRANIKNAFAVKAPAKIKGKRILLIDDVMTTGSTANECARVLLDGGARHVDVLTLAQALKLR